MMQSNNREFAGRNEFWTPSSIGLTQSMIDSSINNIQLNNNSSDLFKIEDSKLKTVNDLPIESKNFIITGNNDEIDLNENNAVNKRYLINKINNLNNKFMTQTQCDNRYLKNDITSLNLNDLKISSGIDFNTSENGDINNINYPKTNLKNLITSDITQTQINQLDSDKFLDNVCPTYQYCDNTYLKQTSYSRLTRSIIYPLEESKDHYEITGIGNQSKDYNNYSSVYEITLPTIKGNLKIVKVRFTIWSTVKEEMEDLHCRISDQSDTVNRRFDGDTKTGSYIHPVLRNNETYYKYVFHFENIFYGSLPKLYLDFFNTTIDSTVNPQILNFPINSNNHQIFKVEIISL